MPFFIFEQWNLINWIKEIIEDDCEILYSLKFVPKKVFCRKNNVMSDNIDMEMRLLACTTCRICVHLIILRFDAWRCEWPLILMYADIHSSSGRGTAGSTYHQRDLSNNNDNSNSSYLNSRNNINNNNNTNNNNNINALNNNNVRRRTINNISAQNNNNNDGNNNTSAGFIQLLDTVCGQSRNNTSSGSSLDLVIRRLVHQAQLNTGNNKNGIVPTKTCACIVHLVLLQVRILLFIKKIEVVFVDIFVII